MPDFQYTARELSGRQVTGVLSAASEHDALGSLAAKSLFPVHIALADGAKTQTQLTRGRVRARHLAVFYTQLADLLRSGVPLLRSLELLERQTSQVTLKHVIQDVKEQVAEGTRLAEAMRRHPRVFGELAVSMVRAGEEGGFLEDVLKRISAFTEHQEELKARVVGAMVYPLFLLVMGGGIVVAMLTFFVPKFTPIFDRMAERGSLPWATTALMSLSESMQVYGLVFAGIDRRRRLSAPPLHQNRRRPDAVRPLSPAGLRRGADCSQFGHRPVLPDFGNALKERRADFAIPANRQGRHRKPACSAGPSAMPRRTSPPGKPWRNLCGAAGSFRKKSWK